MESVWKVWVRFQLYNEGGGGHSGIKGKSGGKTLD